MSSVSGLLVPNNFDIFARSITVPGGGNAPASELYSNSDTNVINVGNAANPSANQALIATGPNTATWQDVVTPTNAVGLANKTIVDGSNNVTASSLFSNNNTNAVNVTASPNPSVGQVLTATGPNAATWQTPTGGAYIQEGFSTTIAIGGGATVVYQSGNLPDGAYGCSAQVVVYPPNTNGISSYRCTATVWITGGVASLRGNGISDNQGGVGAGVVADNPLFAVSGQQITITAGDTGAGNMTVSGVVTLVRTVVA